MAEDIIEGEVTESSELAIAQPAALTSQLSLPALKRAVRDEKAKRQIIIDFVRDQLVEGTDFGKIHISKNCPNKYACKLSAHLSKNNLFKPGQEKIFSLFQINSRLEKDNETLDMVGHGKGVIAYVCRAYRDGQLVAEGRGASSVGEDANKAIKMAEKRARMDACLSLGFSEFFTQDLEDPQIDSPNPTDYSNLEAHAVALSQAQIVELMKLAKHKGYATRAAAAEFLDKVAAGPFTRLPAYQFENFKKAVIQFDWGKKEISDGQA